MMVVRKIDLDPSLSTPMVDWLNQHKDQWESIDGNNVKRVVINEHTAIMNQELFRNLFLEYPEQLDQIVPRKTEICFSTGGRVEYALQRIAAGHAPFTVLAMGDPADQVIQQGEAEKAVRDEFFGVQKQASVAENYYREFPTMEHFRTAKQWQDREWVMRNLLKSMGVAVSARESRLPSQHVEVVWVEVERHHPLPEPSPEDAPAEQAEEYVALEFDSKNPTPESLVDFVEQVSQSGMDQQLQDVAIAWAQSFVPVQVIRQREKRGSVYHDLQRRLEQLKIQIRMDSGFPRVPRVCTCEAGETIRFAPFTEDRIQDFVQATEKSGLLAENQKELLSQLDAFIHEERQRQRDETGRCEQALSARYLKVCL